ncbi:MAG: hypothetical protein LBN10_04005 [Propionibacteriaceae bacterium]|jgi:hypothetical protein|nr:hypothetical protein [Propionibacteriaceae bacterium]
MESWAVRVALNPTKPVEKRLEAVDRLTDQAELAQVATQVGDQKVRKAAIGRLVDQSLLAEMASRLDPLARTRELVMIADKLKDRSLADQAYFKIARNLDGDEPTFNLAAECVGKMSDTALLAKLVARARDFRIQFVALERLNSEADLLAAAILSEETMCGQTVVNRLTKEASLVRVVREAESIWIKMLAARKLSNLEPVMDELEALADGSKTSGEVQLEAAMLTGRQDLIDQACAAALLGAEMSYRWDSFTHLETLAAIQDQDLLYQVAHQQGSDPVWKAAVSRLDATRLERLVGDIPRNRDGTAKHGRDPMTRGEKEHYWKVGESINRLGELAREGDAQARQALERLVTSGEHLVKACTELGHVTDSRCSRCDRCGETPCHVFDWVEEESEPVVHVGRCRACGIIRRWWEEDCETCHGIGSLGEELVDMGSSTGYVPYPIHCPDCTGGRIRRETMTHE